MASVVLPNSLTNGTVAFGSEVKANDDALAAFANTQTVHVDGSQAMTGHLTLPSGTPASTQAVRRDYMESAVPLLAASGGTRLGVQNGDLSRWSSGAGPFTTDGSSTADNFQMFLGGGTTVSTTREVQTVGAFAGAGRFFRRTVVTTGGTAGSYSSLSYAVADARSFAGQTVTVSFWAKATAASKFVSVEFQQAFGSGGSPSAPVTGIGVTKLALTTSWARYSVTVTLPSVSGKTFGTNEDSILYVAVWLDAGSNFNSRTNSLGNQSVTFDDWGWQLEEASTVSAFVASPRPALNEWTTYTPTWSASTTNPSIGNGQATGRWRYTGPKTIDLHFVLSTGTTTTFGSGEWRFAIPPGLVCASTMIQLGTWATGTGSINSSAALFYPNLSYCDLIFPVASKVSATIPHTWTSGQQLYVSMRGLELA